MLPSHSRANGVITGSPPYTVNGLPDEWVALDTGVRFLSIKFRAITHTLSLSSSTWFRPPLERGCRCLCLDSSPLCVMYCMYD